MSLFTKVITIKSSTLPVIGIFELPRPSYFYGTQRLTNEWITQLENQNKTLNYPIIWNAGILSETFLKDWDNPIERKAKVNLWFLAPSDPFNWLMPDHFNIISAMRSLALKFLDLIENYKNFTEITESLTLNEHANAGYLDESGHFKSLLNLKLSGVNVKVNLTIIRNATCETS